MAVIIYGIKNCDTMKKARSWLDSNSVEYVFHDYRKDGLDRRMLNGWLKTLTWEELLNKRGTTWRKLPDSTKESMNKSAAVSLMLEQPAIIKRPLLERDGELMLGFNEENYARVFS